MIAEVAPAKVNLFLHVGPIRADGLHDLASLFVFADDGDRIEAAPGDALSLKIKGPFASALAGFPVESNLVWRAAEALAKESGLAPRAALTLDKRLPVAAGIGGGSADAAAALRALTRLWKLKISEASLARLAFSLGADVPACLYRRPVYVEGAGEVVGEGPRLPPLALALVNPRVETPTGPIFKAFDAANPAPDRPAFEARAAFPDARALAGYLAATRNDLEPHAIAGQSVIGAARRFLAECRGCLIARMSGSGATVFGLFESRAEADRAATRAMAEGWWAMAAMLAGSGDPRKGGARGAQ
ncbi:MAG: 4-(cytidine 5'-diphospho)-2-C-methyl-D-erythritol kinase [Amphiplicatus sp.]